MKGRCLCGAIEYQAEGPSHGNSICHCHSCQRSAGAHAVAWAMFPRDNVSVSKGTPATHQSSKTTKRSFCAECGTSLFCEATYIADYIDITIATLDDPNAFPPSEHIWTSHAAAWSAEANTLPQHPEWPPIEGSTKS